MLDHQEVDFFLCDLLLAAALANILCESIRTGEPYDRLRNEIVVQDDIGRGQQARGARGEQIGIARTCSDEIDAALDRAAKGKLTRLARGRSADVPLSQAMQEQLPLFARLNLRENLAPETADFGSTRTPIVR